MTFQSLAAGLARLVVVAACAGIAIGAVLLVKWALYEGWPGAGPHAHLAFALIAPLGVVLFGILVEQAGRLAEPAAEGV